jgi:hypothetical protein
LGVPRTPTAPLPPPGSWCSYMEHPTYGGFNSEVITVLMCIEASPYFIRIYIHGVYNVYTWGIHVVYMMYV